MSGCVSAKLKGKGKAPFGQGREQPAGCGPRKEAGGWGDAKQPSGCSQLQGKARQDLPGPARGGDGQHPLGPASRSPSHVHRDSSPRVSPENVFLIPASRRGLEGPGSLASSLRHGLLPAPPIQEQPTFSCTWEFRGWSSRHIPGLHTRTPCLATSPISEKPCCWFLALPVPSECPHGGPGPSSLGLPIVPLGSSLGRGPGSSSVASGGLAILSTSPRL